MRPRIELLARATLAAAALDLTACARFVCEARGGNAWREVRTRHFAVATDADTTSGVQLALELERAYVVITKLLPSTGLELEDTIRVIAPREKQGYEDLAPRHVGAYYTQATFGEPTIVLRAFHQRRSVLFHELTHHVQSRVFARRPFWAIEGLAAYMETLGTTLDIPGWAEAGGVPKAHHTTAVIHPIGLGPLLGGGLRLVGPREYAMSWALVHFLSNRHGGRFAELLRRFASGQGERAAWIELFPEWDPGDPGAVRSLERDLREYLRKGSYTATRIQVPEWPTEVSARPLAASAVHDLRLVLLGQTHLRELDDLGAEVDEALLEDRGSVGAAVVLSARHDPRALAVARAATEAHPDDFRAWLVLAAELPASDGPGRERATVRAASSTGASFVAHDALARFMYEANRPAAGLQPALAAVARAPGDPMVLDTVASLLGALSRCDEGAAYERRALDLLDEDAPAERRARLTDRLRALDACRESRLRPRS